jgi:hypothetical protein
MTRVHIRGGVRVFFSNVSAHVRSRAPRSSETVLCPVPSRLQPRRQQATTLRAAGGDKRRRSGREPKKKNIPARTRKKIEMDFIRGERSIDGRKKRIMWRSGSSQR